MCCSGVSMERDLPVIMNLITFDSSAFTTLPPSVHYLRERETASCREGGREREIETDREGEREMEGRVCVVGWGQTSQGQLGLGGIEETTIHEPRSDITVCKPIGYIMYVSV